MEPVGFCGIIKRTTQIIHRNLKHFLCIALILALPSAFLLAFTTSSGNTISLLYNYVYHDKIPSPPYTGQQPYPLIAILVFSIFFPLFTQPLLTFSVCRAVLDKSLSFKGSLLAIPRSALNLILTWLCTIGVMIGLCAIIAVAGLSAIGTDRAIVAVVMWSVVILMVGGQLYLGIAWSLASTVAILEEKRGWEAMKRSMYLVDGSKWVVFSLAAVFGVCMIFLPISATDEASALWRWSCTVLSLGLLGIIGLFSMASTVVLYLSCKSRFKEPVDSLIALNAQFGPLETSAKYMDLESARFDT